MDELLRLAQAGPVAILLVGIVVFARLILKGELVAGYLYQAAVEKRDLAEMRVVELTKILADLATVAASGKPGVPGAPDGR